MRARISARVGARMSARVRVRISARVRVTYYSLCKSNSEINRNKKRYKII